MTLGAHFLDEMELRQKIADAGRAAVGLGSTGKPERQIAYEEWLFPHPADDKFQAGMADAMYSCGLNARSCLRAAGVDAPELMAPYSRSVGVILTWLENVARRMNAYVDLRRKSAVDVAPDLDQGDVLVVDLPAHVIVITDKIDATTFVTSEGGTPEVGTSKDGKPGEKGMCIKSRTMKLRRTPDGRLQTGTVGKDGGVIWGRIAIWAINARWLQSREGA